MSLFSEPTNLQKLPDPCRLARQVKESWWQQFDRAKRLVHLPDKLAGVR
jgi:hypothetical protein